MIEMTPKYRDIPVDERPRGFYVYLHRRATDGSVFYVGKGKGSRGWAHNRSYNSEWVDVAGTHGVLVQIYEDNLTIRRAFEVEKDLIDYFGMDALTNIKAGCVHRGGNIGTSSIPVECSNGMAFQSATEAAQWCSDNGYPKAHQSAISLCCAGKIGSSYGHDWKYSGTDKKMAFVSHGDAIAAAKYKPIIRSDGVEFDSAVSAAMEMGLSMSSRSNISACLNGKRPTAYGYSWSFKEKGPN